MAAPSVKPHRLALVLVAAAVTAAILALFAASERQHRQTVEAEAARLDTAAKAVDEHMRGVLLVVDNLLKQVIADLDRADLMAPPAREAERRRILVDASRFLPGSGAIFLIDAQGDILYSPVPTPPQTNFADRQYFRDLKAGHDGLHVGRAIHGRVLPGVYFTAARGLRRPEGEFEGVIVAAIDIAFGAPFYQSLDLGEGGSVSVYRMSGEGVMRFPANEPFVTVLRPAASRGAVQARPAFSVSPTDGVERLSAYREMADHALYIMVGKPSVDILSKWRRDVWEMGAVGILFLIVIAVLVVMMLRGFRREEAGVESLQRSNDRIKLALRMVPVTLSEMDRSLRYTWVANPIPPLRPEDFIGKTQGQVFETVPAPLDDMRRDVLQSGRPRHLEVPFTAPDGRLRHLDFMVEPQWNARGDIIGLRSAITDITERVEEKIALMEAKAAADQANQAKSRFLAAASHDLRQPLQALRLFLDVLTAQLAGSPQECVVRRAREAMTNVERLMAALLDMSRLEADLVRPEVRAVPIAELVNPVVQDCQAQAADKKLELRWHVCTQPALTDVVLFQCILRNLLVNAIRYTERGGILIGCRRRGDTARIEVWDTGSGIPADRLKLIFEEFYRMPESEAQHEGGLGLGLSIVERTARLLGHAIEVRSRPGRGTVFAITLPLAPATPDAIPALDQGRAATQ